MVIQVHKKSINIYKAVHPLLPLFFIVSLAFCQNTNSESLGSLAGRVYSFIDDTDVVVSITLRQYDNDVIYSNDTAYKIDSDIRPICIQKFMNGTFFCDSIPTGYYEAEIKGVPFDEDFQVVKKGKPTIFRPVRIAPDSISLIITRLRADHPNYKSLEDPLCFLWDENILPDTSDTYFICGRYNYNIDRDIYNRFYLERDGYFCRLRHEINSKSGKYSDSVLKVHIASKRLNQIPGEIIIDEAIIDHDIYLNMTKIQSDPEDSLVLFREPAWGVHEILFELGTYTVHFIGEDTSSIKIEYKLNETDYDVIRSGSVEFLY